MTNKTVTMSRELVTVDRELLVIANVCVMRSHDLLVEQLKTTDHKDEYRAEIARLRDARTRLLAVIAAPVVERQEPLLIGHLYRIAEDQIEIEIVGDPHIKDGMEVFTSPPAPVAVVRYKTYITQPAESLAGMAARQLKDEKRWIEIRDANSLEFPDMCASDYYPVGSAILIPVTACLDKVKELNQ